MQYIFPLLLLASVIVAATIGIQAFTKGIQLSGRSKEPVRGLPAQIVGVLCLLYAVGVVGFVGWIVIAALARG